MKMKNMKKLINILFSILIFLVIGSIYVSAQDSEGGLNEWFMFGRYLNHSRWDGIDFPVVDELLTAAYHTNNLVYSSPSIANGYVYVGSYDSYVYQLNATNINQFISKFATSSAIDSSPAIANGYVYIANQDGYLYQLNSTDVSKLISTYFIGATLSSPAIVNGYVYISDYFNGDVYQLNATNISKLVAVYPTYDYIDSSPAFANGYVYITAWSQVYQLNATDISKLIAVFPDMGAVTSSPAVADGYLYFGGGDGNLYQLNATNISKLVSIYSTGNAEAIQSSPAIANGYVYFGSHDNNVYQLNANNVSQLISIFVTGGMIGSSPAVSDGYVYIASEDDILYKLDSANISDLITKFSIGASFSSPAIAKNYVYVGGNDGNIYQISTLSFLTEDGDSSVMAFLNDIWDFVTFDIWEKLLGIEMAVNNIRNDTIILNEKAAKTLLESPKMLIQGTEYTIGDIGKTWLQLLTSGNEYVSNATCFVDIHKPDGTYLYTAQLMNYLSQGIYYYDLIIPSIVGVYPVAATCAYQTGMVSFNATNGQITIGTQYLVQNYTATWLYDNVEWRIDESLNLTNGTIGTIYRLNFNMTFANVIVPNFTSQMIVEWSGRWNGNAGDDVTIRVWNYSSSSWLALPSLIEQHGTTRYTLSNSITIPNYNLTAMGLIQNGIIILKFNDTAMADVIKDNIQNDQVLIKFVTLGTGIISEIKGSSEIHVSSPTGRLYCIETLCGDINPECAIFTNESDLGEPQGMILDNITITNDYGIDTNAVYEYETALGLDCTGVLSILRNSNGTITDVYNQTTFRSGLKDNCILSLPIYFTSSEPSVVYELKFDNYLKWEIEYYKNLVALYNLTIYNYCIPLGISFNHTYTIPLATFPTQETILTGCDRALDDLYWFYYFYDESQSVTVTGEYESFLSEAQWYYPKLREHHDLIQTYNIKNNQNVILNDTSVIKNQINNLTVSLNPNSSAVENLLTRFYFSGGTEYYSGNDGLLVIQFFKGMNPLNNKSVTVKVFYPDMSTYLASTPMIFKEDGIYYYNFTIPSVLGVYTASAQVTEGGQTYYASHTFHVNKGLKAMIAK